MLSADAIRAVFPEPHLSRDTEDSMLKLELFLDGSSDTTPQVLPLERAFFHKIVGHLRKSFLEEFEQPSDSLEDFAIHTRELYERIVSPQRLTMLDYDGRSMLFLEHAFAALCRSVAPPDIQNLLDRHIDENSISSGELSVLGLLVRSGFGPEVKAALSRALPRELKTAVDSSIKSQKGIPEGLAWIDEVLIPRIKTIIGEEEAKAAGPELKHQLVHQTGLSRAKVLSEMIIHDQTPPDIVHVDLQNAIREDSSLPRVIIAEFSERFAKEVLNVGVETSYILLLYLRLVRLMSRIEPALLLSEITGPIRRSLKDRADTIATIVTTLFGSLMPAEELRKLLDTGNVVENLLSIYENKEVFTKQLAVQFSEELLMSEDPRQVTNLRQKVELLEARFGEWQLQNIHVMIADIEASADVAEEVHGLDSKLDKLSPLILSRLYWPGLHEEGQLRFPPSTQRLIDEFARKYMYLSDDQRVLRWLPTMGRVHILIELSDRSLEFRVTPEQASLLSAFQDIGGQLTLSQLESATGLSNQGLLSALQFWIDRRVIGTELETYKVMETEAEADRLSEAVVASDSRQTIINSAKSAVREMEIYWSYIQGMLHNLGSLPLDRIHSFLTMLVPKDDPYVKTKEELETFLLSLVEEEKLACIDGKFSLK